jgi:hypothetical protein
MNRQSGTIIWLLGTALAVLTVMPVSADNDGQIVVSRQVQPRTATRPPLVPDPNPRIVKTSPEAYVDISNAVAGGELSDSDFARVNSGMATSMNILGGRSGPLQQNGTSNQRITRATSGIGGKAGGGGGTGGIAGTVNQGVQQGLRPLMQALPGQ